MIDVMSNVCCLSGKHFQTIHQKIAIGYCFLPAVGIAKAIKEFGVEWDIIPGECTGLIQPIDVGVGKTFKHRIWYWLEKWLAEHDTSKVDVR